MKRAVITGCGAVSPFGIGYKNFSAGIMNEQSAVTTIDLFPANGMKCRVASRVPEFDINEYIPLKEQERISRAGTFAIISAGEAMGDAGIDGKDEPDTSVIIGSGAGGIEFGEKQYRRLFNNERNRISPFAISSSQVGMISSEISLFYKLHGASHTLSNGCPSSSDALGYAMDFIRSGRARVVVAGGADACIIKGIMSGFERMKVMSTAFNDEPHRASRPFDRDRDGFVLGEGAYMFVIEELEHAKKRGANIYAELLGYGATCEAYHRVALGMDGTYAARAIHNSLADAGIPADEVDYVNTHGTSTRLNDRCETNALKTAFGERAYSLALNSTKSYTGHPQGASGSCGLAAVLLAFEKNYIHPTLNLEYPDPECDLNYTPLHGIERKIKTAVVNCLGFGSKNSALVVSKFTDIK